MVLVPLPVLDGGPIVKWSLVNQGSTQDEADEAVRKVNDVAGFGLIAAARNSFRRGNRFYGFILVQLALAAVGFAVGLIHEKRR